MTASTEKFEELALYVVATPIGNLHDLSNRAAQVLTMVDLIAAEDTRHTRVLLAHIGARARLISAHTHNERASAETVIQALADGKSCALVSDAGTPAISDPGARLVYAVRQAGYRIIPVPGASAAITLLSAAGIDADRFGPAAERFVFGGFLSTRTHARLDELRDLHKISATVVLLESPRRIVALLQAIEQIFGEERVVVLGRELSKRFEQIVSLPVQDLLQWTSQDSNRLRGEFVLAIAPPLRSNEVPSGDGVDARTPITVDMNASELMSILGDALAPARAARLAARLTGLPKDGFYTLAVAHSDQGKNNP